MVDVNSMLLWHQKIKNLDIPQPKTEQYIFPEEDLKYLYEEKFKFDMDTLKKIAKKIGYPLFVRTDLASGKHSWNRSCYVEREKDLERHIIEVIESNLLADLFGLKFKALFFREFIPMDSKFTAFWGEMPVNPERRYFIKDGKIQCHHHYWIEEAIRKPSIKDWKKVLKKINTETKKEIEFLSKYVMEICKIFPKGYHSVDFCKAKDGRWILIDMATGESSWHYDKCKYSVKPKDLIKDSKIINEFETIK